MSQEDLSSKEILKDRERIKKEITRIIESFIEGREKKIKHKQNRNTTLLERIIGRLIFMVDNPDKMRKQVE